MAVKIADTLKALSNTFPVAECIDIDVNINGTTKRLQKAIDDGDIGDGSDSTWKGTKEEWEALSTEEKGKYEVVCFTNDYDDIGICENDSIWKGTKEEWENLLPTEKEKYEVVYFTDDYDDIGIFESDSTWKGTLEEWEALSTEEKGKYEVVCFTNDYDGSRLIDDSIISNKTTYSSTKIEEKFDIIKDKINNVKLTEFNDVEPTNIAPSDTTTFVNFKDNSSCNYYLKNGICYVSLWGVKITSTGSTIKTGVFLPECANIRAGALMTGNGDATTHAFAFVYDAGELCFDVKDANISLFGSFSYPVKES